MRQEDYFFLEAFFAVPAEEYGDIAWRVSQARAGRLEFLGGKPELLRLGHFDDVDLSMIIHTTSRPEDGKAGVPASNNGCVAKRGWRRSSADGRSRPSSMPTGRWIAR